MLALARRGGELQGSHPAGSEEMRFPRSKGGAPKGLKTEAKRWGARGERRFVGAPLFTGCCYLLPLILPVACTIEE